MNIRFDLRWYVERDGPQELTAELFQVLRAVEELGSLRAAAAACDLSYRHTWGLLRKWHRFAGHPLVCLERGKGASLTGFGQKLVWEQQRIRARLEPTLSSMSSELASELNALLSGEDRTMLRVRASHGLAVAQLRDLAPSQLRPLLDLQFHGSLDSLKLFKNGHCELAGFHIPEGGAGSPLLPRIRDYLSHQSDTLIYALRRRQGLMTASNNPYTIHGLKDLTRKPVRFVNRQINSGTRTAFDSMLVDAGIDGNSIDGYHNEEFTHLAVAALVASGAVDCGFGIEEAARQFKLNFIPFHWEAYWFVVAKDRLPSPAVSDFLELLRSSEFASKVADLSGYEASGSGSIVDPDREFEVLLR